MKSKLRLERTWLSLLLLIVLSELVTAAPVRWYDFQRLAAAPALPAADNTQTAQLAGPPPLTVQLQLVASGLTSPISLTHANDNSGRKFVVDQAGLIRIIDAGGNLLPTPFLDLTAKLPALNPVYDERGLLGMTFHPDYAANGRFFVRYSAPRIGAPEEPCSDPMGFIPGCHKEVLAEYTVSVGDPNIANPLSEIILFSVDKPEFNHNAGSLAFGPDGFLYFTMGDGGGANDGLDNPTLPHGPNGNGQNINAYLGKMLRIDVDSPPQLPLPYAIPPDNPFVGVAGHDEIYAYGFRNPFGFSFDDGPGGDNALYLADVGQVLFEEIDIVTIGGNYGWVIKEGFECFDPFDPGVPPATCADAGMIDPISVYDHASGGLAVLGGYVYRGSQSSALVGKYLYGDFSANFGPTGRLYYFDLTGPAAYTLQQFRIGAANPPFGKFLKGTGEDESGEFYYLASSTLGPSGTTGEVLHVVADPQGACCTGNACELLQEFQCAAANGQFFGPGSACSGDPDGDGFDDNCEACPQDPNKIEPGICGCGVSDDDSDGDATPDCQDGCPADPGKTAPGICGCGIEDVDIDGDGTPDCAEIPTVSFWGLIILAIGLLTLAKIRFRPTGS